jgi:hypothetical protein
MATPKIRIKRPAAVVEPEPEEEPVVAEAEDEEVTEAVAADVEDESPYEELSIEDLRAEATSRKLDSTGKRSALIARLEEDDAKPVVKKAAPVAPKPVAVPVKPVAKPAPAPVAPKPVAVAPKVAPTPIPQKADEAVALAGATLADLFELMINGHSLILSKEGDSFILSMDAGKAGAKPVTAKAAAPVASGPKLRGDAFWKEVLSEEYYSWYYEDAGQGKPWGEMTQEEKVALADEIGVDAASYAHDDQRMANMRMVEQVQKTLGLEKYKPQYKSAAAREALKS